MATREKVFIAVLAGIVVALAAAFAIGWRVQVRRQAATECNVLSVDTVIVHDTVRITEPVEVSRTVYRTVYVPAVDTLTLHDTLYIRLEREQKVYADSSYRAWVSGIRPALDSIHVYPETRYVNTVVETVRAQKNRHWGVGVTAGYGISTQGLVPYIGVGISYNIITF